MNSGDRIQSARELCEAGSWTELLKFTQSWHAENPLDAKALFYRGVALTATGRIVEAETIYRRALELDGNDFKTWNNLAGILFDVLERPQDAIQCLEQALKLEPRNKLGWANLASMAGRLGRHEKALEFADRALALDPQMVEAYLHKGAAARALGKSELVRDICDKLAAIEPENFRRAH